MSDIRDLTKLLDELKTADVHNDAQFQDLVARGLDLAGISDAAIAEKLGISRPSATRWGNGRSAPHPALRPMVFAVLCRVIERRLQEIGVTGVQN